MEKSTLEKIKANKELHKYIKEHSIWYKHLNRNPENYNKLLKEFKEYKRIQGMNKVNQTIENIEMFSNVIKFVE